MLFMCAIALYLLIFKAKCGGFLIKKTENDNIKTLMKMIAIKVFY